MDIGGGSVEFMLADENHIYWKQSQMHGVIRKLKSRSDWDKRWENVMRAEPKIIDLNSFQFENLTRNALPHGVTGIFAALPFAIWFFLGIEGLANVSRKRIDAIQQRRPGAPVILDSSLSRAVRRSLWSS